MSAYTFTSAIAILLCGIGLGIAKTFEHLETTGYTTALVSLFLFMIFNIGEAISGFNIKPSDSSGVSASGRCGSGSAEERTTNGLKEIPTPNEAFNLIKNRRSITPNHLTGEKVRKEVIDCILEAANWAPTHGKTEPWRFVVFSGPEKITEYLEFLHEWYKKYKSEDEDSEGWNKFIRKYNGLKDSWPSKISHLITIGMKRQARPDKLMPEWEETSAVACAFHNMHLMLTSYGLAGFWSSHTWCKYARDSKELKEYLNLNEDDKLFGALVLGKVDDVSKFKSDRKPVDQKVQWRID